MCERIVTLPKQIIGCLYWKYDIENIKGKPRFWCLLHFAFHNKRCLSQKIKVRNGVAECQHDYRLWFYVLWCWLECSACMCTRVSQGTEVHGNIKEVKCDLTSSLVIAMNTSIPILLSGESESCWMTDRLLWPGRTHGGLQLLWAEVEYYYFLQSARYTVFLHQSHTHSNPVSCDQKHSSISS